MGILDPPSTTSSPPQSLPPAQSSSYTPPTRTSRTHCYAARDAFFACLDAHSIIDPIKHQSAASTACGPEDTEFLRECAMSWVTYFKQRRVMEFQKKATLEKLTREGAREVPMAGGVGAEVGKEGR